MGRSAPFALFQRSMQTWLAVPRAARVLCRSRIGRLTMVWVVLDQPVQDGDGHGPYREGEISSEYLSAE
jgi:hypothetical protein